MVTTPIPVPDATTDGPAPRRPIARRIGWGTLTLLSLLVGAYAVVLVASGFAFVPSSVTDNRFPTALGLYLHIVASGIALIVGPFQFLRALRHRWPLVHRWLGRTYVLACLAGGAAGGAIALFTAGGLVAGFGFLGLAVAWIGCTLLAYTAVRRRDYLAHQRWMIRSFALTFAAVTLRLYLTVVGVAGLPFEIAYPVVAWLCWVPNLLVAQALVRQARGLPDF